jgi:hypothetical protein
MIASAAEIAAWIAAIAVFGDSTHFTWWGIAAYVVFLCAHAVGAGAHVWLFVFVVQLVVVCGVVTMSATRCDLLLDALVELHPFQYVLGNFVLHYAPAIGTLARYTSPIRTTAQSAHAAVLFSAYCAAHRPDSVYGCEVPYNAVVFGGSVAVLSVSLIVTASS